MVAKLIETNAAGFEKVEVDPVTLDIIENEVYVTIRRGAAHATFHCITNLNVTTAWGMRLNVLTNNTALANRTIVANADDVDGNRLFASIAGTISSADSDGRIWPFNSTPAQSTFGVGFQLGGGGGVPDEIDEFFVALSQSQRVII